MSEIALNEPKSKARLGRLLEQMKPSASTKSGPSASTDFNKVATNVLKAVQAKRAASGAKPNASLSLSESVASSRKPISSVFQKLGPGRTTTTSDSDRLISAVMAMDEVYTGKKNATVQEDDDDDDDDVSPSGETLPLITSEVAAGSTNGQPKTAANNKGWGKNSYGSTTTPSSAGAAVSHRRHKTKSTKSFLACLGRCPLFLLTLLVRSFSVTIGIPLVVFAVILFYVLESGLLEIDFLPGDATLVWWLIFAVRQCVTLDAARIIQWILVDYVALSSKIAVQFFGPFLTLVAIQSHGWPFLATWWSLLDLTLLYGDNKFQRNWFYMLEEAIFRDDESGGDAILVSDIYLRILLSVLVAGVATSIKRTTLAMYFGQTTVVHYRSRLERLLADISVIAEVAQLADEASKIEDSERGEATPIFDALAIRKGLYDTKWHTMTGFAAPTTGESQRSHDYVYDESEEIEGFSGVGVTQKVADSASAEGASAVGPGAPSATGSNTGNQSGLLHQSSTPDLSSDIAVMNLLDSWDEPVNKLDKTDVSINDILQFQKALTYMDEKFPFSAEFGPATSRDECVKSSQDVYQRLLKLSARPDILSFSVLTLLSLDESGLESNAKTNTLKRVFRPDKSDELPLLAFVQSCDAVYKRLRFFRASVSNSSVIDKVLQDIIDVFFYFALALLVLSMMNFDPWPLLASVSTLLISFSFAFGNSTARIVDGILLIAAQRPFDLGDRIVINSAEDVVNYGVDYSWYVEDINLFTTTLRFAKTNEVATVSNGTIIQSRIVNCQRSQNALVTLHLEFRLDVTDDDVDKFVASLEDFVQDRPRIWDSLVYFQCESINSDDGVIKYTLRARHNKTWQDAPQILASKAELIKFCNETSKAMGINH